MKPLFIGIAGGTGAGKTTMAQALSEAAEGSASVIEHDAYYRDRSGLPQAERDAINYDHPEALENELLAEHLDALCSGHAIDRPTYDYFSHTRRAATVRVDPAPVIIVEGILVLAVPDLRDRFQLKIFVQTDPDLRVLRRVARDLAERARSFDDFRRQYLKTVRPMHDAFVEPSKRYADVIIPEGGSNPIAIELLANHVRAHVAGWDG